MAKNKRDKMINNDLQRSSNTSLTKNGGELMCFGRVAVSAPHVALVQVLLLQIRWYVMNEKMTILWWRQTQDISYHLWHRYSVTVNRVISTIFEMMTSTWSLGTLGSVASLFAATFNLYSMCTCWWYFVLFWFFSYFVLFLIICFLLCVFVCLFVL